MERLKIETVTVNKGDRDYKDDEGCTRYCPAWYVCVIVTDDGRKYEGSHRYSFDRPEEAWKLGKRVLAAGDINEDHWYLSPYSADGEPYWATPEFAERERLGTL